MKERMRLSICVIAYNEESFLPNLLSDLRGQEYPHELTEVVLVSDAWTSISSNVTRRLTRRISA